MYKNITVINKDDHKNLRFKHTDTFGFASAVSHAPIVTGEFFAVCKSQPILFIKNDQQLMASAVLGLKDGQNLFLDDKKRWKRTEYCPFVFKRYPFVYVNMENKLNLAYDTDCDCTSETEGEPIFDENGEQTKFTSSLMELMHKYHMDSFATAAFCDKLNGLGLLSPLALSLKVGGKNHKFEGFLHVDEKKFNELAEESKMELIRLKYYDYVVAHLISLACFEKLAMFALEKQN